MNPHARRHVAREAGFTLIEVLLATLLMTVILAALATVTAQWLPNWNRGMAHVQRAERLAVGLSRIVADLAVAEMVPMNGDTRLPLFEGAELTVTFVRTAVGPSTRPGLEIIRLAEKADDQGLAMVRERTSFVPMPTDAQIRFADQVVLIRAPFRVTFSYAGADQVWQPSWRGQMQAAECARAKNALACLNARSKQDGEKKTEKEEQL
jgi:general secretion pathway protein J